MPEFIDPHTPRAPSSPLARAQDRVPRPPRVVALIGQTASGKNGLAVEALERLATRREDARVEPALPCEIISLDSMKVFRGMDLGTAKPSAELRARVPHHLIDVVDPSDRFDAARFFALAARAELEIRARGRVPLYVGGTGMYLHFLRFGFFDGPAGDPAVRATLDARYAAGQALTVHAELSAVDPASAARLHANDQKRVVRALEVYAATGRPLSEQQREDTPRADIDLRLLGIRWPFEQLAARIDARCADAIAAGWIDETRALAASSGFGPQAGDALGYREILASLAGTAPFPITAAAELTAWIAQRTRRFARKQMTWFRKFPVAWLDHTIDTPRHHASDVIAGALERALA